MARRARSLKTGVIAALGVTAAAACVVERLGRRSGATREEARMSLPGDDIVARPLWASTRAFTIDAPPEEVWPWVVQMGFPPHRAGWYTPHWLDVAMWGDRPRSADRIVPELQELKAGDTVPDSEDYSIYYDVVAVQPPHHLLLHSRRHVFPPIKSSDFGWVFVLLPTPEGGTRFVIRARVSYAPLWALPIVDGVIGIGDLVNVSVMFRGIRKRVLAAR